jgi:coenzyme PQQ precursor peptide PqqA
VQTFFVCTFSRRKEPMKTWMKPSVREQEVGLEVTSYLPAEIDLV